MYVYNLGYDKRKRHHGDIFQSAVLGRGSVDNFDLFHELYKHNQSKIYVYMVSYDHNKQLVEHICHKCDKPELVEFYR